MHILVYSGTSYKGHLFQSNAVLSLNKGHLCIKDNFHGPSVSVIEVPLYMYKYLKSPCSYMYMYIDSFSKLNMSPWSSGLFLHCSFQI